jgi:hypothetical protein
VNDLGPPLDLAGDKLCKVGGRPTDNQASQVGEALPGAGIGQAGIDLLVELVDDLARRIAEGKPQTDAARSTSRARPHKGLRVNTFLTRAEKAYFCDG